MCKFCSGHKHICVAVDGGGADHRGNEAKDGLPVVHASCCRSLTDLPMATILILEHAARRVRTTLAQCPQEYTQCNKIPGGINPKRTGCISAPSRHICCTFYKYCKKGGRHRRALALAGQKEGITPSYGFMMNPLPFPVPFPVPSPTAHRLRAYDRIGNIRVGGYAGSPWQGLMNVYGVGALFFLEGKGGGGGSK